MKIEKKYIIVLLILLGITLIFCGIIFKNDKTNSKEVNDHNSTQSEKIMNCTNKISSETMVLDIEYKIKISDDGSINSIKVSNKYSFYTLEAKETVKKKMSNDKDYTCIEPAKKGEKYICTKEQQLIDNTTNQSVKMWYVSYADNLKENGYTCNLVGE